MMKKSNKKGFTLVELIVVIAIMAILAAVLVPTVTSKIKDANKSAADSSCSALANSIQADVMSALAADNNKCVGQHGTITIKDNKIELGTDIASGDSKIKISLADNTTIKIEHDDYKTEWYYTVDINAKVTKVTPSTGN